MKIDLVEKAKDYAYEKHNQPSDCQRYGSLPYAAHLDMVVANAIRYKYLLDDDAQEDVIMVVITNSKINKLNKNIMNG